MPKFYFFVHDRQGDALDNQGAELPSLEAAMLRAADGARSMMSETVRAGDLDLTGFIEIEDEYRVRLARITYFEVLTIYQ